MWPESLQCFAVLAQRTCFADDGPNAKQFVQSESVQNATSGLLAAILYFRTVNYVQRRNCFAVWFLPSCYLRLGRNVARPGPITPNLVNNQSTVSYGRSFVELNSPISANEDTMLILRCSTCSMFIASKFDFAWLSQSSVKQIAPVR